MQDILVIRLGGCTCGLCISSTKTIYNVTTLFTIIQQQLKNKQ